LNAAFKSWLAQFKRGDFSTCVAPRPGRHKTVNTHDIIDQIQELILVDCWISAKLTAEQLDILRARFGSILREDLDMRKHSAKCVPKFLNVNPNLQRCLPSEQDLEFFRRDRNASCRDL
jgi:hypothetical protein